jgi:hypothetical protein
VEVAVAVGSGVEVSVAAVVGVGVTVAQTTTVGGGGQAGVGSGGGQGAQVGAAGQLNGVVLTSAHSCASVLAGAKLSAITKAREVTAVGKTEPERPKNGAGGFCLLPDICANDNFMFVVATRDQWANSNCSARFGSSALRVNRALGPTFASNTDAGGNEPADSAAFYPSIP